MRPRRIEIVSATVGSLKFTGTGWTVDGNGLYVATLAANHTVGSGKKAKKYRDVLEFVLDPEKGWMEDQLTGAVATVLTSAPGLPLNEDILISVRRNPFGDKDNADAKSIAVDLAALGTQSFADEAGLAWNLKVSSAGVATISRTTGTGKKKKTTSATAVVEVADLGGGNILATARFLVAGKIITATW